MKKLILGVVAVIFIALGFLFFQKFEAINENALKTLEVKTYALPQSFQFKDVDITISSIEKGEPIWAGNIGLNVSITAKNNSEEERNAAVVLHSLFNACNYTDSYGANQLPDSEIERRFTLPPGEEKNFIIPMEIPYWGGDRHVYLLRDVKTYQDIIQEKANEGILYYEVIPVEGDFDAWK